MRVPGPELVAPEANGFVGDQDASPGQDVLDVPMAYVEAVVEPDGVLDDLGEEIGAACTGSFCVPSDDCRPTPTNLAVPPAAAKS